MTVAVYGAFLFTVALLVATAYFLMGGLPLLILKHDISLDARFIRSFFNLYYRMAVVFSLLAGLSYAAWGKPVFAAGAAAIAAMSWALRRVLLRIMEDLGSRIEAGELAAIARFRRIHGLALLINLVQLVVVVGSMVKLTKQLS